MIRSTPQHLSWFWQISKQCLDLLFPPVCVGCQQAGHHLCAACAQKVEPVGQAICDRCGTVQHTPIAECLDCQLRLDSPLVFTRTATRYVGAMRQGIHHLKYENCPELAPLLARYLVTMFAQTPWPAIYNRLDGVVPVPLHAARRAERGYNQTELLATAFCQQVQLPLRAEWLKRTRATQSQVHLNAHQRQANVEGAFQAQPQIKNKTILLIDDVYTTGATLRGCAAAAMAAGATAVYGLTLATPIAINMRNR
ncbi:MAG: ComF family protein [Chloroflexi bacterium]|nr:ComF family protein [Chloroflexota bacterium]